MMDTMDAMDEESFLDAGRPADEREEVVLLEEDERWLMEADLGDGGTDD